MVENWRPRLEVGESWLSAEFGLGIDGAEVAGESTIAELSVRKVVMAQARVPPRKIARFAMWEGEVRAGFEAELRAEDARVRMAARIGGECAAVRFVRGGAVVESGGRRVGGWDGVGGRRE
jgi:hypothetical protein